MKKIKKFEDLEVGDFWFDTEIPLVYRIVREGRTLLHKHPYVVIDQFGSKTERIYKHSFVAKNWKKDRFLYRRDTWLI